MLYHYPHKGEAQASRMPSSPVHPLSHQQRLFVQLLRPLLKLLLARRLANVLRRHRSLHRISICPSTNLVGTIESTYRRLMRRPRLFSTQSARRCTRVYLVMLVRRRVRVLGLFGYLVGDAYDPRRQHNSHPNDTANVNVSSKA
jgi:hypothetical protein